MASDISNTVAFKYFFIPLQPLNALLRLPDLLLLWHNRTAEGRHGTGVRKCPITFMLCLKLPGSGVQGR
ncbi:hypothetical protein DAPPPG734_08160 [Pantoea agglomerans]|uniref:Uncharacterized protein n=1 Tax=Enterobacter agglomerans TaxID=549 RepID=A0AAN2FBP4_ENTAG|nr:hypothetical protein DAPPPG734_08160 [Pantoea agglomerans]